MRFTLALFFSRLINIQLLNKSKVGKLKKLQDFKKKKKK